MKPTKNEPGALVLFGSLTLVATVATAAYVTGSALARRWMVPPALLPDPSPTSIPASVPRRELWIAPEEAEEGFLDAELPDEWRFRGEAGQSATIEMWLHPGSGSNVDGEMVARLLAPDGTTLVEAGGSVFLAPYLFVRSLPTSGVYGVEVLPVAGTPGRYSLELRLSSARLSGTPTEEPSQAVLSSPPSVRPPSALAAAERMFQWPTTRRSVSGWIFQDPGNPGHKGLDIAAALGDRIVSVAAGEVVFAHEAGDYGNLVIVEHAGDWRSYYAHLERIRVKVRQQVQQGEIIGEAGTTGESTGPHLHFELRYRDRPVDPHIYLP